MITICLVVLEEGFLYSRGLYAVSRVPKMKIQLKSLVESLEMLVAGGLAGQYAKCLVSKGVSEISKVFNKKITQNT